MSKELKDFKKHMEITKRKIKVMEEMRDLKGRLSLYSRLELEYYKNNLQYLKGLKIKWLKMIWLQLKEDYHLETAKLQLLQLIM